MSKPPVIFSPRFFRLLWLIVRERFRSGRVGDPFR